MYLDFFGLLQQPFGVTPDPAFLYFSPTHLEALEALRSDLLNDRGFMTLVGDPGLGKTTLLYKLIEEWRQTSRVVFLFQTQCDSHEFFRYLLGELGVDAESMGLAAMHHKLNHILFQEMLAGRRFVLIVDEAQNLDNSMLETVRGLSNFETEHAKLLNIVLAGQSQLAAKLAAPELHQLRQRIGILNRLRPLAAHETAEYIKHRLAVAGYFGESIFSPEALQAIAKASQGAPRSINHICHQALSAAATRGLRTINLEIAQNSITRLDTQDIGSTPSSLAPVVKLPVTVPVPPPAPVLKAPPPSIPPVRPCPPPPMVLSYGWAKKSNLKLRSPSAIASCVLLLVGVAFSIPSVRRFAVQECRNLLSSIHGRPPDSGIASRPEFNSVSEATLAAYDPDSPNSLSSQIIVVSPRTGQTIEELSQLYVGHFDQQLFQQVRALNPDIKDFDHLESGQLIRLPLPPGTLKKVIDTDEPSHTPGSATWQLAVAKIKELFSNTKH